MKASKVLSLVALALATAAALYRLCYLPYRCSLLQRQIRRSTVAVISSSNSQQAARLAKLNIARLGLCERCCKDEVGPYMIRAANYRILGRLEDAIGEYQKGLHYERRPELYMNLGETQLEAGFRQDAIHSFTMAMEFNPAMYEQIPHPEVKTLLYDSYRRLLNQSSARLP